MTENTGLDLDAIEAQAAAEAYPKAPGYGYTFNRTRRQQREAFEAGWNAHASRLSRPTREELIEQACEFLHDAYEEAAVSAGWQTQEASRTSWDDLPIANKATMRVAVAALFREFSLSAPDVVVVDHWHDYNPFAPEEKWEYGYTSKWGTNACERELAEQRAERLRKSIADTHRDEYARDSEDDKTAGRYRLSDMAFGRSVGAEHVASAIRAVQENAGRKPDERE